MRKRGGSRIVLDPVPVSTKPELRSYLEALDYMESVAPAVSPGIMDLQAVIMQNVRLVEATRIIGEWRTTRCVEKTPPTRTTESQAKNIFGLVGSAT